MRRKRRKGGGQHHEVTIERLGGRGDGLASTTDPMGRTVNLFAPLTAPGDRVRLREVSPLGDGVITEILELLAPSPQRQDPPCPHFGACGGCQLQHLTEDAYRTWKYARAVEACQRIIDDDSMLTPMISLPTASRRRARVIAEFTPKGAMKWGFRGRASHQLEPITGCLVLEPTFQSNLDSALTLFASELKRELRVEVQATQSDSGLDLLMRGEGEPDLNLRFAAGALNALDFIARLAWQDGKSAPEILLERQTPTVLLGDQRMSLPPGAFLQPSAAGERVLQEQVATWAADAKTVIDLYCGIGTLTLPLVGGGRKIIAYDSFAPSIKALNSVGARVGVEAHRRDLSRQPLSAKDLSPKLSGAEVIVLDPPRAGAKEQIAQIADSGVPRVIYVSCNPTTFARDGRKLVDAGYRFTACAAVDQFTWSAELEVVGLFELG